MAARRCSVETGAFWERSSRSWRFRFSKQSDSNGTAMAGLALNSARRRSRSATSSGVSRHSGSAAASAGVREARKPLNHSANRTSSLGGLRQVDVSIRSGIRRFEQAAWQVPHAVDIRLEIGLNSGPTVQGASRCRGHWHPRLKSKRRGLRPLWYAQGGGGRRHPGRGCAHWPPSSATQ